MRERCHHEYTVNTETPLFHKLAPVIFSREANQPNMVMCHYSSSAITRGFYPNNEIYVHQIDSGTGQRLINRTNNVSFVLYLI
jgi:hypothetical protein